MLMTRAMLFMIMVHMWVEDTGREQSGKGADGQDEDQLVYGDCSGPVGLLHFGRRLG